MSETDREAAWDAVHNALPLGWAIGPPSFDPARSLWEVVARSRKPLGRGRAPVYVIGEGIDETAALHDLTLRLAAVSRR